MTISTTNTTYENCPICQIDYTDTEREDTKKVVELACTHFFHMQCIGSWFSQNEQDGEDLSCGYCAQTSVQKYTPRGSLTVETLATFFEGIKKNPTFDWNPKVINCIKKLRSLSEPLIELINNNPLDHENKLVELKNKIEDWIKANIDEELQRTAMQIILEIYNGGGALHTLEDQIRHLSRLPYDKWPKVIQRSDVPVYQETESGIVRMRVSKNYLERAIAPTLCDILQKHETFHHHIENIKSFYNYDRGVRDAIPHAINLQKELSRLVKEKPVSSVEKIFLLLQNTLEGMHITDELKEDCRLIIYSFLFNLPALRTLTEEVDRWKKIPIRDWPPDIRRARIRVLDEYDSLKEYKLEHFIKLVRAAGGTLNSRVDIGRTAVVVVVITGIFVGIFKNIVINRIVN